MSKAINHPSEIPESPFYVTARDNFMSGWGRAKGKDCVILFACTTREEAKTVASNARSHSDMSVVWLHARKDQVKRYANDSGVLLSYMLREESGRWFVENAF